MRTQFQSKLPLKHPMTYLPNASLSLGHDSGCPAIHGDTSDDAPFSKVLQERRTREGRETAPLSVALQSQSQNTKCFCDSRWNSDTTWLYRKDSLSGRKNCDPQPSFNYLFLRVLGQRREASPAGKIRSILPSNHARIVQMPSRAGGDGEDRLKC